MPAKVTDMSAADQAIESQLPGSAFRRACREMAVFECLEQALLVSDRQLVIGDWGADTGLAEAAAAHARRTCDKGSPAVQIQYVQLGDNGEARLLYVKPVQHYLSVLVATNQTTLGLLRRLADKLAEALQAGQANGGRDADGTAPAAVQQEWRMNQTAIAIAWRPVEPLPRAMRKIIQVSAQHLAKQEGCHLSFVGVASDHVHLVLQCPRRRKGAWVAHAFKKGIEADIARRYGTKASLWQKGFLAHPSSEPIGAEALLAYLNH